MSDDFFSFFVISVGKGAVSMVIQSNCKHRRGKWSRKWLALMTHMLSFERTGMQIWHVFAMCFSLYIVQVYNTTTWWMALLKCIFFFFCYLYKKSYSLTLTITLILKMVFLIYQKHMSFDAFQIDHSTLNSVSSVKTTAKLSLGESKNIFASAVTIAVIGC